jgi:membrane-associated phospholipid phosphatase
VTDAALIGIAAACVVLTALLGLLVARHRPTLLDVQALRLRGHGTPAAVLFTRSGYWPTLCALAIVLFGISFFTHTAVLFAMLLGLTQLLSQAAVEGVKAVFRRIRPDDWLYHQELGFSYPSGHATTAVVFFGGIELFVWSVPLPQPVRLAAAALTGVWMAGIPWSRMVLSAHHGTDVLGGIVFGTAWLCALAVVLGHLPGGSFFG